MALSDMVQEIFLRQTVSPREPVRSILDKGLQEAIKAQKKLPGSDLNSGPETVMLMISSDDMKDVEGLRAWLIEELRSSRRLDGNDLQLWTNICHEWIKDHESELEQFFAEKAQESARRELRKGDSSRLR